MDLKDLERNIQVAYLNYDNNDLKTAVKQLDMFANSLLRDDKTLDPVWTGIARDVYMAVMLNNFSKGMEFSLKDLRNMLNNQETVYNNVIEFCNKFENNAETTFATSLKKISDNPLKSAIQILQESIDKLTSNISNSTNDNVVKEDTTNSKIQTIKCFCGNEIQVDWSIVPNTEKTIYLKCPKCGSELKRGNPFALGNTNSNSAISTPTNDELVTELRDYIKNNSGMNILEDWYSCKNSNPKFKEFFDETEKESIQELVRAKDKATILKHRLDSYISIPDPHRELGLNNLMITYFGLQSIYDRKLDNIDGKIYESLSIDNVGLFRAVLVINIVAIMYHISDNSLPMGLKLIFERKEFIDMLGPIVKDFIPKIIPSVNEIKFFYKQ